MTKKPCCANCKYWTGMDEDDVAACKAPISEAHLALLEDEFIDDGNAQIAGDKGGEDCQMYKRGTYPKWKSQQAESDDIDEDEGDEE